MQTQNFRQSVKWEEYHPDFEIHPNDYIPIVGEAKIEELKQLAAPLEGRGWANVNSTMVGGGVAEMLQRVIPLARALGINAEWNVIKGNENFFKVTKKFHNLLQGEFQPISLDEIFGSYLQTIDENARNNLLASDLVVVHDPQPAAMVMNGIIYGNILWRCHIDTSHPNQIVWRFLLPYINHCAGAIFTMPEFIGPGLQIPIYQIMPSIDPLSVKNHPYTKEEALEVLSPLLNEYNIDPDRPIITSISRYDIHKNQQTVLKAFQKLRREKKFDPPPYLIFLGNSAADDPEGDAFLKKLKKQAGDDEDIIFWVNVKDNDRVVGSLMHLADVFIHVSTKEGFGLVVSESLWQGTPVIGSRVGGIVKQVMEGDTGFVVDPFDADTIAEKAGWMIENPDQAKAMGERGREHVRNYFLLPELVRKYLVLMQFYTQHSEQLPSFRLNDLSYSEVISGVRAPHPYMKKDNKFKRKNILQSKRDKIT